MTRAVVAILLIAATVEAQPEPRLFAAAAGGDDRAAEAALAEIARGWRNGYAAIFVDLARFLRAVPRTGPSDAGFGGLGLGAQGEDPQAGRSEGTLSSGVPQVAPAGGAAAPEGSRVRRRLLRFLEKQTGQRHGDDLRAWRRWMWSLPYDPHPDYATFKGALYANVDPRMAAFFPAGVKAAIRLDEIDWGGVAVNGIPPLDAPRHVPAAEARGLKDGHVVFGIAVGGESRAYPKRILAWHELARDRLGGVDLAIVYCTLCGTVIPYEARVGGARRTFGTSGLLYRSNKLLFDEESMSLWSTLEGRPVVGPLVGSGLQLRGLPVVTTTWGEWKAAHPGTTVLSEETGFERDYREGAAYREYFATDALMFEVPNADRRLPNKAEVLALRLAPAGAPAGAPLQALAIDAAFLRGRAVHHLAFAGHDLVVLTTPSGANRVYDARGTRFVSLASGVVRDDRGREWRAEEDALRLAGSDEARPRVAAHRAFWFGWFAQFPETELVR